MSIERQPLRRLLVAMRQPRTFYVLGAGVSYGLVPITNALGQFVAERYHAFGAYPILPEARSPLFERVFGKIAPDEQDIRRSLLTYMPYGALEFLTQYALWRRRNEVVPPQYAVFEMLGAPATLFNFNLDGLASVHCANRHIVIEPHGRIDNAWFEALNYSELIEATALYDLRLPHLSSKLLPSSEPKGITAANGYQYARRLFRGALAMIIVGYSFGRRPDGLDDAESFDFLVKLVRHRPCPVFVLSPDPTELVETLRDALSSFNVCGLPVRWEVFAGLVLAASDPMLGLDARWSSERLSKFVYEYERNVDIQQAA